MRVDGLPFFSVVMPTRNRPELFARALSSVLSQDFERFEVVVINDGSGEAYGPAYELLTRQSSERVRWFALPRRDRGHGPSYAINTGVENARGAYVCFLDDDDCWVDDGHLSRAHAVIAANAVPVDMYLSNQRAFHANGDQLAGPIWLEDLPRILSMRGDVAKRGGAFDVGVDLLLLAHGFCHLNTLIVRREFFRECGGMDEMIRWEGDRELYFRLLDRAHSVKYVCDVVARHNVPDPSKMSNETTSIGELEKRLTQLKVFDKLALLSRHKLIRAYARRHRAWTLKKIAVQLAGQGRFRDAASYARSALGAAPSLKWALYSAWISLKGLSGA
jgi:glycosyltransferase involved in cell wall biosynthesis